MSTPISSPTEGTNGCCGRRLRKSQMGGNIAAPGISVILASDGPLFSEKVIIVAHNYFGTFCLSHLFGQFRKLIRRASGRCIKPQSIADHIGGERNPSSLWFLTSTTLVPTNINLFMTRRKGPMFTRVYMDQFDPREACPTNCLPG